MTDPDRKEDERTKLIADARAMLETSYANSSVRLIVEALCAMLSSDRAQAPLPEDGERTELVAFLRTLSVPPWTASIRTAADLLEQDGSALRAQAERIAELEAGLADATKWLPRPSKFVETSALHGVWERIEALLSSSGTAASGSQEQKKGETVSASPGMVEADAAVAGAALEEYEQKGGVTLDEIKTELGMGTQPVSDPIERIVADGLDAAGVKWERGGAHILDFYVPEYAIYIEVKQFHTDRVLKQLAAPEAANTILIQGREAATAFARLIQTPERRANSDLRDVDHAKNGAGEAPRNVQRPGGNDGPAEAVEISGHTNPRSGTFPQVSPRMVEEASKVLSKRIGATIWLNDVADALNAALAHMATEKETQGSQK